MQYTVLGCVSGIFIHRIDCPAHNRESVVLDNGVGMTRSSVFVASGFGNDQM